MTILATGPASAHVLDKNREISPLERERGRLRGKGSGEKLSFKTRMEDPVTPTTDLGAESEPGDEYATLDVSKQAHACANYYCTSTYVHETKPTTR